MARESVLTIINAALNYNSSFMRFLRHSRLDRESPCIPLLSLRTLFRGQFFLIFITKMVPLASFYGVN